MESSSILFSYKGEQARGEPSSRHGLNPNPNPNLASEGFYLTVHLTGEPVQDSVPVLLLAAHLLQKLLQHGAKLLRIKLEVADFALHSRFLCFLKKKEEVTASMIRFFMSVIFYSWNEKKRSPSRFPSPPSACRPSSPQALSGSSAIPVKEKQV